MQTMGQQGRGRLSVMSLPSENYFKQLTCILFQRKRVDQGEIFDYRQIDNFINEF